MRVTVTGTLICEAQAIKAARQELFNEAAPALLKQNKVSQIPDPYREVCSADLACAYRGADGLKCAIGHVLTDAEFEALGGAEINSAGVGDVLKHANCPARLKTAGSDFLSDLQTIHDSRKPVEWAGRLRAFAAEHGLSAACIEGM
jgi:hypothetical protein